MLVSIHGHGRLVDQLPFWLAIIRHGACRRKYVEVFCAVGNNCDLFSDVVPDTGENRRLLKVHKVHNYIDSKKPKPPSLRVLFGMVSISPEFIGLHSISSNNFYLFLPGPAGRCGQHSRGPHESRHADHTLVLLARKCGGRRRGRRLSLAILFAAQP